MNWSTKIKQAEKVRGDESFQLIDPMDPTEVWAGGHLGVFLWNSPVRSDHHGPMWSPFHALTLVLSRSFQPLILLNGKHQNTFVNVDCFTIVFYCSVEIHLPVRQTLCLYLYASTIYKLVYYKKKPVCVGVRITLWSNFDCNSLELC